MSGSQKKSNQITSCGDDAANHNGAHGLGPTRNDARGRRHP
jgi:hypothetical protein